MRSHACYTVHTTGKELTALCPHPNLSGRAQCKSYFVRKTFKVSKHSVRALGLTLVRFTVRHGSKRKQVLNMCFSDTFSNVAREEKTPSSTAELLLAEDISTEKREQALCVQLSGKERDGVAESWEPAFPTRSLCIGFWGAGGAECFRNEPKATFHVLKAQDPLGILCVVRCWESTATMMLSPLGWF